MASLLIALVLVTACGGLSAEPRIEPIVVPAAGQATTVIPPSNASGDRATIPTSTRSPAPAVDEVDLVTYVSVIEHLMEGTDYAGAALEAPEVFLATGALFCEQLDAGVSSDAVLTDYLETLTGGPVDDASDDDLSMAGAVLGSALATLCPHHIHTVGVSE